MSFVECSAKSSENIEKVFIDLTKDVIARIKPFDKKNDSSINDKLR